MQNELVETLLSTRGLRIERIVSRGHSSPEGFWYDQEQSEWVLVLQGQAIVRLEGENQTKKLIHGDFLLIPAHTRHRVDWTTPDEPTIWLAIFY